MGNRSGKARKKEEKTKTPESDLLERRVFLCIIEGYSHWPESLESTLVAGPWPLIGVSQAPAALPERILPGGRTETCVPHFSIDDWAFKFHIEWWESREASFSLESNIWSKIQHYL